MHQQCTVFVLSPFPQRQTIAWRPWYPLAAQTVFSLLDHLSDWHRARSADHSAVVSAVAKSAASINNNNGSAAASTTTATFKPTEEEKARLATLNLGITRVSEFLQSLSHATQAKASLKIGGLARALRCWEMAFAEDEAAAKATYVSGFVDRTTEAPSASSKATTEILIGGMGQDSLIGLLDTFTALHDSDGEFRFGYFDLLRPLVPRK